MLFIVVVLSIPVYGYCIWSLYEPEEAFSSWINGAIKKFLNSPICS
ncbi:hypothetical protein [Lysinibacillus sp. 3P01SB]